VSYDEAKRAVVRAQLMLKEGRTICAISDEIWKGCDFPFTSVNGGVYLPAALGVALALYDQLLPESDEDTAHCMLLLGRIYSAKGDNLAAKRFYIQAERLFGSMYRVIAKEYLRELPAVERPDDFSRDTPETLIGEHKRQFEAEVEALTVVRPDDFSRDTPETLIGEHRRPLKAEMEAPTLTEYGSDREEEERSTLG
jgi:hypothetical protein